MKRARDIYAGMGDSGAKEAKEIDEEILWGSYWQRMIESPGRQDFQTIKPN
jgi:hypothetical protein